MKVQPIIGPAGVGKSTYMVRELLPLLEGQHAGVIVLTFSRPLKKATIAKTNVFKCVKAVLTVHSLAYRLARPHGLVPSALTEEIVDFAPIVPSSVEDKDRQRVSKGFDTLIQTIIEGDASLLEPLAGIGAIVIDEYQDLREDYIAMLRRIAEAIRADIYVLGDPNQSIYTFNNKQANHYWIRKNFTLIGEHWNGFDIESPIVLSHNHRSKANIQEFVNAFLDISNPDEGKYEARYRVPEVSQKRRGRKPQIRLFAHQNDEFKWVKKEVGALIDSGKSDIAIMSHYRREIRQYEKWVEKNRLKDRVRVDTVHAEKGLEASIVFIIGASLERPDGYPEEYIDAVFYTAITRAKDRLYITTAHPAGRLEEFRGNPAVEFIGNQNAAKIQPYRLPKIRENANYSLKKISNSHIDSVVLRVWAKDAPFRKHVRREQLKSDKGPYKQGHIDERDGVPMTVTFLNGQGIYHFSLKDISALTRNGFTDYEKLTYAYNRILEYFDYRMGPDVIEVSEFHLARLISTEDVFQMYSVFGRMKDAINAARTKSVRDHMGWLYEDRRFNPPDRNWASATYYVNCTGSKRYQVTLAIYHPKKKDNGNGISSKNVLKLEWRIKGPSVKREYALGKKNMNLASLLQTLNRNGQYLSGVFDSISGYFDMNGVSLISRMENAKSGVSEEFQNDLSLGLDKEMDEERGNSRVNSFNIRSREVNFSDIEADNVSNEGYESENWYRQRNERGDWYQEKEEESVTLY